VLFGIGGVTAGPTIDLNEPGAFETLQCSNSVHFEKIQKILAGLHRQPEPAVPRWLQGSFDARDVSYLPILMVTGPPKRRLSFTLDVTRYEIVRTLDTMRGSIVPAR
jgi:hypothetical protein